MFLFRIITPLSGSGKVLMEAGMPDRERKQSDVLLKKTVTSLREVSRGRKAMLKKYKLSTRIALLGIIITTGFLLTFAWLYPTVRQKVIDGKYLKTRHVVETAWGVLDFHLKKVKANQLTMEEGKKQALEAIKSLRYEKDDYFWINDMQPKMIMHPMKPEMDGKDLTGYSDPNGKKLFVSFVEKVKADGAGFVDYYWPKPGLSEPVSKISYVKGFPEWGWVVGSGIYIDDVQKEMNQIFYLIFSALLIIAVGGIAFAFLLPGLFPNRLTLSPKALMRGLTRYPRLPRRCPPPASHWRKGLRNRPPGLKRPRHPWKR
jgi:hypothetical protein